MKKRGQVTVFIILGIVLVAAVGLTTYLLINSGNDEFEQPVAPDVAPVTKFIENCLSERAKSGIIDIGSNGGFIRSDLADYMTPAVGLATLNNEYTSASYYGDVYPLWWYDGKPAIPCLERNDANCKFTGDKSIEGQLEKYVEELLPSCLNYDFFSDKYSITALSKPKADVIIQDEFVRVEINYPIEIVNLGTEVKVNRDGFRTDLPVRLRKVYDTAVSVLEQENNDGYFEYLTLRVWDEESGDTVPSLSINPNFGVDERLTWERDPMKRAVQSALQSRISYIYVEDLNNALPNMDEVDVKMSGFAVTDVNQENLGDLVVSFNYIPNDNDKFHIRQGTPDSSLQSSVIRDTANSGAGSFSPSSFSSDIFYPVEVAIVDQDSFGNEGYNFYYFFPVMIKHNAPARDVEFGLESLGSRLISGAEICDSLGSKNYTVTVYDSDDSSVDNIPGELSFVCGETCVLGSLSEINDYTYVGPVPDGCISGGEFYFEGDGYSPNSLRNFDEDVLEYEIPLKVDKELTMLVVDDQGTALNLDDYVVEVEYISETNNGFVIYSSGNNKIPISAGTYSWEIIVKDKEDSSLVEGGFIGISDIDYYRLEDSSKLTLTVKLGDDLDIEAESESLDKPKVG